MLLGNAVRLLHPIAGQGYNLALRDVAALVVALGGRRSGEGAVRGESLSRLRALGLIGLDTVAPLRRRFARAAMGLGG